MNHNLDENVAIFTQNKMDQKLILLTPPPPPPRHSFLPLYRSYQRFSVPFRFYCGDELELVAILRKKSMPLVSRGYGRMSFHQVEKRNFLFNVKKSKRSCQNFCPNGLRPSKVHWIYIGFKNIHSGERIQKVPDSPANSPVKRGRKACPERKKCDSEISGYVLACEWTGR